jgi:hypothetical protein
VAVGQHPGYNRFVIDYRGGIPSYVVTRQLSARLESGDGSSEGCWLGQSAQAAASGTVG